MTIPAHHRIVLDSVSTSKKTGPRLVQLYESAVALAAGNEPEDDRTLSVMDENRAMAVDAETGLFVQLKQTGKGPGTAQLAVGELWAAEFDDANKGVRGIQMWSR